MKIAFFELEGWEKEQILGSFPLGSAELLAAKLDEHTLPDRTDFEVISVFVGSRVNAAVLDHLPNLKLITTRSTGYDHIDLPACRARNVAVAYVPGYGDNTVAEFAFGLLLAVMRKIYQGIDRVKEHGSFDLAGLRGCDLKGKTLGVIGTGRIGKEVVRIGLGFGMQVAAFDLFPDVAFAAQAGIRYMSLDELLASSDAITVHCPLTDQTRHLLNSQRLEHVKRGAFLINTARGGIIETEALVQALQNGTIAGAGLDVIEEEGETKDELNFLTQAHPRAEELRTLVENHILMRMPNVLVTPHMAFNSQEALGRILKTTIDSVQSFLEGKPANLVPEG
ncbi:MAG: hydroxyacid dehydrogenase [Candidatus Liptonbacteria bacterium]|nr:hydroxyacid dehydrogenase [Candidatus Liptonbacteria bacterium]